MALAAGVIGLLFAVAPGALNRFGSVKQAGNRQPMDDFSLRALDGSSWRLSAQRGGVVLVNFWATWCPPCRAEIPDLASVHTSLAGRGFSVVGIAMDDDPLSVVPAFAGEHRIPYSILLPDSSFELANRIDTLPTSLLIDRNGRVARTYSGMIAESTLRHDVEQLLSEGAGR